MSDRKKNRESQNKSRSSQGYDGVNSRNHTGAYNEPRNNAPRNNPSNGPYQNGPYNGPNQNGPYSGSNQNGPYNGQYSHSNQNGSYNGSYQNGSYQNSQYNGGPYQNGAYQNGPYNGQGGGYNGSPNGTRQSRKAQNNGGAPYPGEGSRTGKSRSKRKARRRVLFIIEILILLVLAGGLFVWAKMSKVKTQEIADGKIIVNSEISSEQVKVLEGYRNIALYGVDSRDGLTQNGLSDTIMIASINKDTKDVKLVSVYRDTYLDNTNGEFRKATECYLNGGPERSINMLNKNLDMDITDYMTINFNGIADIVDALQGVEINIEEDEIVHLNNYQVEGSEVTNKPIVPVTSTGLQTLNGLQALSYCRIRYTEGNDYKRTERQRTVLEEIMKKAKTTDILKLNNIIDATLDNISTSMSPAELVGLAKDVAAYNIVDTTGFPFDLLAANISAGDCVVPVNLSQNVTKLHQYLFGGNDYAPSATVNEISNKIINETGIQ